MQRAAYSQRFDQAMRLAVEAFRHTHRKATDVPYLTHLLAVTALVGEHGGDEDQMIAALLHDYLEDVPEGSASELERDFGPRVARLVLALSDTVIHPKPPWEERKKLYLAHLAHEPAEVKLISAADKFHNATSIVRDHRRLGDAVFDRFRPSREQTLWYYRSCVSALRHGWEHPLADDLEETVARLHQRVGVVYPG